MYGPGPRREYARSSRPARHAIRAAGLIAVWLLVTAATSALAAEALNSAGWHDSWHSIPQSITALAIGFVLAALVIVPCSRLRRRRTDRRTRLIAAARAHQRWEQLRR